MDDDQEEHHLFPLDVATETFPLMVVNLLRRVLLVQCDVIRLGVNWAYDYFNTDLEHKDHADLLH